MSGANMSPDPFSSLQAIIIYISIALQVQLIESWTDDALHG